MFGSCVLLGGDCRFVSVRLVDDLVVKVCITVVKIKSSRSSNCSFGRSWCSSFSFPSSICFSAMALSSI